MKTGPRYLLYLLLISFLTASTDWQTLHSSKDRLTIEVIFDINPDDKLEPLTLLIGLPANELPSINVRSFNKRKMGIVDISDFFCKFDLHKYHYSIGYIIISGVP